MKANVSPQLFGWFGSARTVANFQTFFGVHPDKPAASVPQGSKCHATETGRYVIKYSFWYWFFTFAAMLGDEVFYISVFPFWFWNIDGVVGRKVTVLWALSMFAAHYLKETICIPRPACPPVVRLEERYANEWGFPSSHALVSITVPFSVILLTMDRYTDYNVALAFMFASAWTLSVCCSRLYLGMHTPADILAGLLLGVVMLATLLPLVDSMDAFLLTHAASPFVIILVAVSLVLIYPTSKYLSTKEDTAIILAAASGAVIGNWLGYQLGTIRGPPVPPPYPIIWPSYSSSILSLVRTCAGLVIVLVTRWVSKVSARALVNRLCGQTDKAFAVVSVKMINYAAVGFSASWLSPIAFRWLSLERPTYHTEM